MVPRLNHYFHEDANLKGAFDQFVGVVQTHCSVKETILTNFEVSMIADSATVVNISIRNM